MMKKFFELRMKSGRSIIASTNKEGVCQFFINDNEFCIFSQENGRKNFTFSVEKNMEQKDEKINLQVDQDLEVVFLQELVIKKKAETKDYSRDVKWLSSRKPETKKAFLRWKETFYFAKHGGIQTPAGWIYGRAQNKGFNGRIILP